MIIVMKADASPEQVVKVAEQVETLGLKPHVIEGSERTVVAVVCLSLSDPWQYVQAFQRGLFFSQSAILIV